MSHGDTLSRGPRSTAASTCEELQRPCRARVTVTSIGERGAHVVFGVIYPPRVALVGFGRIDERPVVHAGQAIPRPAVIASLSTDHRASDGHRGAALLRAVERGLQAPEEL